jgi:hypothetical protein
MATQWIAGLRAGVVAPARSGTRAAAGVLAAAVCGLMLLGPASSAYAANDHVYAVSGQSSVTGPLPDAAGGVHNLGPAPDCAGGGGVHD